MRQFLILMPVNHQLYSEWDKARFLKWASGMVARAAKIASDDLSVLDRFADGAAVPEYAKQAAAGMIEQGMLNGYEDNMLHLDRPILRAETFTLLEKLIA